MISGIDHDRDAESCASLDLVSVSELLDRNTEDIDVPKDEKMLLSPANEDLKACFGRVQLAEFEDLQALGIVPRGLSEDHMRRAIEEDNEDAFGLAQRTFRRNETACACMDGNDVTSVSRASPVRRVYNQLRNKHNPALARAISEHFVSKLSWDSPVVEIARKWVRALPWRKDIVVAVIGNITIGQNATMTVSPMTKSLLANHIWIHSTGRLVSQSAYLKIWANALERMSQTVTLADIEAARKIVPIWKVN